MRLPRLRAGVLRDGVVRPYAYREQTGLFPAAGMPVHGNYCGPGHGDPTYRTPPRDPVDAACMRHDQCYDRSGYFDCNCDRRLVGELAGAVGRPGLDEAARTAGLGAMAYFSTSTCVCRKDVCVNVPYCNWRGCGVRRVCHQVEVPGVGGHAPGCG
ncbi:hypothetical protein Q31b_33860 [Novipirellula aureliae]|uniref:Phospholipase A2 domain-containing protein n=1 Tax=Novipirellula aureliae TaxID=2527966 RepID=A0A5C6DTN3_9BACT|nr:hypothetical protein [Novipirellula aureliae]TWU40042.1 hypothetical protein Q31b_33860 [Novipirellula aureliae]